MRRWITIKEYITNDHETLQTITIYPIESTKENVKAENRKYSYTRLLLVPEKEQSNPIYSIRKISRV